MSQRSDIDLNALAQLDGVVLRLVEQQGAQATRRTTDNLDEQAWLEDFLEASKPELPSAEECAVRHRLLLTPFRYQKRHGSRFATRWERGMFMAPAADSAVYWRGVLRIGVSEWA